MTRPPELPRIADPATAMAVQRLYELIDHYQATLTAVRADVESLRSTAKTVGTLTQTVTQQAARIQMVARNAVATPPPSGGGGGGGGGTGPGPPPPPGSGALPVPPSQLALIQALDAANPGLLINSCLAQGGTRDFLDLVVTELRLIDVRWGYNGKRGDVTDISEDAVDYYWGADLSLMITGNKNVYTFDFIAGHCPLDPTDPNQNPTPTWDLTGTGTGNAAWVFPRP